MVMRKKTPTVGRSAASVAQSAADRFTAATNDQSILSKASAVKIGYWKDDLLLDIVPRVKVRSPFLDVK